MVEIKFNCLGCGTSLRIGNPDLAGKKIKCPKYPRSTSFRCRPRSPPPLPPGRRRPNLPAKSQGPPRPPRAKRNQDLLQRRRSNRSRRSRARRRRSTRWRLRTRKNRGRSRVPRKKQRALAKVPIWFSSSGSPESCCWDWVLAAISIWVSSMSSRNFPVPIPTLIPIPMPARAHDPIHKSRFRRIRLPGLPGSSICPNATPRRKPTGPRRRPETASDGRTGKTRCRAVGQVGHGPRWRRGTRPVARSHQRGKSGRLRAG